jgi:hypothetical protein
MASRCTAQLWQYQYARHNCEKMKSIEVQLFHLLKVNILKRKQFTIIKMCFSLPFLLLQLIHDTTCLATAYWKRVRNHLGTSLGSIVNVRRSHGFGILIWLASSWRSLLRWGRLMRNVLSNGGLLIALRLQINFDRYQKVAAIDQTPCIDRLFGQFWRRGFCCT